MITIERHEAPMTAEQEASWAKRRRLSWVLLGIMIVLIGGLGWAHQTAQNKYEAERAQSAMWKNIIDHTPAAVIATNGNGEIVAWSNGAERLFGWTSADVIGSTTEFLMPCAELRERHRKIWADEELKQEVFDGLILELVTDAATANGEVIQVKGKVAGVTNAHRSFIINFYPNKQIRNQGTFSAEKFDPLPPAPLPPQAQHQMQQERIAEN